MTATAAGPVAVHAALNPTQWALLILISRRERARRPHTATAVLVASSDAGPDDLAKLQADGLIHAHLEGRTDVVDLAALPADPAGRRRRLASTVVRITGRGGRWLEHDPHNRVLTACLAQAGPVAVGRLGSQWGLHALAIAVCCDRSLTVLTGEGGRPARPDHRLIQRALDGKPVGVLQIALTPAGRAVADPTG